MSVLVDDGIASSSPDMASWHGVASLRLSSQRFRLTFPQFPIERQTRQFVFDSKYTRSLALQTTSVFLLSPPYFVTNSTLVTRNRPVTPLVNHHSTLLRSCPRALSGTLQGAPLAVTSCLCRCSSVASSKHYLASPCSTRGSQSVAASEPQADKHT